MSGAEKFPILDSLNSNPMPYKEPKVEKLFYSIGEVAAMFDVNTSLIRFWENEFDIIKPKNRILQLFKIVF